MSTTINLPSGLTLIVHDTEPRYQIRIADDDHVAIVFTTDDLIAMAEHLDVCEQCGDYIGSEPCYAFSDGKHKRSAT